MHVFHHKTRKPKFYVGVPVIFFLEVLAVIGIFCAGGKYMGNTAKKENAAKTASLSSTSREGLKRGEEFTIEKQEFKKSLSQESFSIPFNTMDECYRVGDLFVSFDSGTKSKLKIYFCFILKLKILRIIIKNRTKQEKLPLTECAQTDVTAA